MVFRSRPLTWKLRARVCCGAVCALGLCLSLWEDDRGGAGWALVSGAEVVLEIDADGVRPSPLWARLVSSWQPTEDVPDGKEEALLRLGRDLDDAALELWQARANVKHELA